MCGKIIMPMVGSPWMADNTKRYRRKMLVYKVSGAKCKAQKPK